MTVEAGWNTLLAILQSRTRTCLRQSAAYVVSCR
jgi:hypothetical protein